MKKLLLAVILLLTLSSCVKAESNTLKEVKLDKTQQELYDLVSDSKNPLFLEYNLSPMPQSIIVKTYQMKDGQWDLISSHGSPNDINKGLIYIDYENLGHEIIFGLKTKNLSGRSVLTSPIEKELKDIISTSFSGSKPIQLNTELPLAIQVSSQEGTSNILSLEESLNNPSHYIDYDKAYLLTIEFSDKILSE